MGSYISKLLVLLFLAFLGALDSYAQEGQLQLPNLNKDVPEEVTSKPKSNDRLDVDQQKSRLSLKYTKGPYLVYDCFDKHWVCTDEIEAKNCREKRRESILEHDLNLPCAVFKQHESDNSCINHQQHVTDQNYAIVFCLNPKFKQL